MASTRRPIGSSSGARSTCARTRKWQRCSIACVVTFTAKAPPAMIASGKSARIVNGGNGVGSAQSAKRLRVGHRGHHGTRLKAGNASQRRKTSPVRQQRSLRLSQNSLFCDVAEVSNTSAALIGIFATCSWSPESYKDREGKEAQANAYRHRSRRNEVHDEAGASRAHNAACRVG